MISTDHTSKQNMLLLTAGNLLPERNIKPWFSSSVCVSQIEFLSLSFILVDIAIYPIFTFKSLTFWNVLQLYWNNNIFFSEKWSPLWLWAVIFELWKALLLLWLMTQRLSLTPSSEIRSVHFFPCSHCEGTSCIKVSQGSLFLYKNGQQLGIKLHLKSKYHISAHFPETVTWPPPFDLEETKLQKVHELLKTITSFYWATVIRMT